MDSSDHKWMLGSPQAGWHLLLVPRNCGHSEGHLLRQKSQVIVRTVFLVTREASDNYSRDCSTRALIQMLKAKLQVRASAPSPTSSVLYELACWMGTAESQSQSQQECKLGLRIYEVQ